MSPEAAERWVGTKEVETMNRHPRKKFQFFQFGFLLIFLVSTFRLAPARDDGPVPLPHDANLAAYVGVSGNFQSVTSQQVRALTMTAYLASYAPFEQPDITTMHDRLITELNVPDEPDWGLFDCVDENLSLSFTVTDALNRLGSIAVYEYDTGLLVGLFPAAAGGGRAEGVVQNDESVRDYRVRILDAAGGLLGTLLMNAGRWDKVAFLAAGGGFQPFRPDTIRCNHGFGDTELPGDIGNPKAAEPTRPLLGPSGFAEGCCLVTYPNDSSQPLNVSPPGEFLTLKKREVILQTVIAALANPNTPKPGDPADVTALQNLVNQAYAAQDFTRALSDMAGPPYSNGCPHWHAELTGVATGIVAVPYERKKPINWRSVLISGIVSYITPEKRVLSAAVASAANNWLLQQANQARTGLKPGDVMAYADLYSLITAGAPKQIAHIEPILEDVTFRLQPDIAPSGGSGTGLVEVVGAATTPAPPVPVNGGTLSFSSAGWTATLSLAKGWKWKVTGNIVSPMGYDGSSREFQTPVGAPVNIPCTLRVLLSLKVFTWDYIAPRAAHVQLIQNNQVVREGDTVRGDDGSYAVSFQTIAPGTYTVKATAPFFQGTTTISVGRGVEQSVTVIMTFQ